MVCFKYITVNTLQKNENYSNAAAAADDDDDNNNNNKVGPPERTY
jgi:hypothetical protein